MLLHALRFGPRGFLLGTKRGDQPFEPVADMIAQGLSGSGGIADRERIQDLLNRRPREVEVDVDAYLRRLTEDEA